MLSLVVMPALAFVKQRVGKEMGSRALVADSKETWVCSYLSLTLLLGVGAYAVFGWWWADPVGALAMLPVILWQGWETLAEAREPADHDARSELQSPGEKSPGALVMRGLKLPLYPDAGECGGCVRQQGRRLRR